MKNVPHWQLLMVIYFILVAVPVYILHLYLKKNILKNRTFLNLMLYFGAVVGCAFLMNFITLVLYYKFIFSYK